MKILNQKIKEIAKVVSGSTPRTNVPEYWEGDIPWVTPKELSELDGKYLHDSVYKITQEGFKACSTTMLPKGTILFSSRAPIGLLAIANIDVCTNQGFKSLVPNKDIHSLYLYYALKSKIKQLKDLGRGATFKELSKEQVDNFMLPIPENLEDQIRIASLLSRIEELIAERKESIRLLDEFVKSTFLEMFGDPVRNEKGWEEKLLIDGCNNKNDIKCGPFGTQLNKSEFNKNGIPLWGIPQINSNFKISPTDFLTKEKAEELSDYSIQEGDIVMSRKGTVGKCALYPSILPNGVMHSDVLRIRIAKHIMNPTFLCYHLRISEKVEKQIDGLSSGAIMAGINVGKLKNINILFPPLSLQNHYAVIVEKVETTRIKFSESLSVLEKLYGAVSQRAFRGEM
jgi:type I restriction enzyme S subunit